MSLTISSVCLLQTNDPEFQTQGEKKAEGGRAGTLYRLELLISELESSIEGAKVKEEGG